MKLRNLFYAASLLALVACSGGSPLEGDNVEYYPVILDGSKSWSFIDSKGKVYLEDEFSNEPSCVIDNIFAVRENDGYTVYEFDKKPKAIKGLEDLKCVGFMDDGLLGVVKPKERISFVNSNGETKFTLEPIGGKEIVRSYCVFSDGLLLVCTEDDKIGFVDKNGKPVIKPIYTDATLFNEGYALVSKEKDDDKVIYIINKKGEEVAKLKSSISPGAQYFKNGVMPAYEDMGDGESRAGFINTKGEFTKLDKKVKRIIDYNSKIVIFRNDDSQYGIITRDGEELVRAKYESLMMIDDNTFVAEKDDKYFLIDKNGDKKDADFEDYNNIFKLSGKGFGLMAKEGKTYMLIDKKGDKINKDEYDDIGFSRCKSDVLSSDYFNINSFVDAIASLVSTDGIGKYKIGTPAKQYLSDAKNYTYTYRFTPDDQPADGYRYSIEYTISASEVIARSDYDYWGAGWSYYFNPDSKIDGGTITARAQTKVWPEAKSLLVDALKDKGFRIDDTGEMYVSMKKGDCTVNINSSDDGEDLNINLTKIIAGEALVEEAAPAEEAVEVVEVEDW